MRQQHCVRALFPHEELVRLGLLADVGRRSLAQQERACALLVEQGVGMLIGVQYHDGSLRLDPRTGTQDANGFGAAVRFEPAFLHDQRYGICARQ